MGKLRQYICETFPAKPDWSADSVPDLTGRVMAVTGANSGVGKEVTKVLLQRNATVYMLCRNKESTEAVIKEFKELTGKEARFIHLDLADLKSVKECAEEFLRTEKQLDVLFANGGIMMTPMDRFTAQGYDAQFGTNVLGHYYLAKLLLPLLLSTAKSSPDKHARIIHTSSMMHWEADSVHFETLTDTPQRKKYSKEFLYGQSKVGNILLSNQLAKRYGAEGLVSVALHPGQLKTNLAHDLPGIAQKLWQYSPHTYPPSYGALTLLRAGTTPEGLEWNGKYATVWARLGVTSPVAQDVQLQEKVWDWCEEQVKKFEGSSSEENWTARRPNWIAMEGSEVVFQNIRRIPAEIWTHIFSFACTDDGRTGRSLALVSKYIHNTSAPVRYQSISLVGYDEITAFLAFLEANPHVVRRVKDLYISSADLLDTKRNQSLMDWIQRGIVMVPPEIMGITVGAPGHPGMGGTILDFGEAFSSINVAAARAQQYREDKSKAMMKLLKLLAPSLERLSVHSEHGEVPFPLPYTFPRLVELDVHHAPILLPPPADLALPPETFYPALERLHISGVAHLPHGFFGPKGIPKIAPRLTHLRLSLAQCNPFTMGADSELADAPERLPATVQCFIVEPPPAPPAPAGMDHHPIYRTQLEAWRKAAEHDSRFHVLEPHVPASKHRRGEKECLRREAEWLDRGAAGLGCWLD
ncbi:NAD(P)-binding protein [Schizophyllum commune H4-8]|uniref:NAD(P)-binding protein n=1 Tax=Schizophyllum commune (strain H4-8 / FGSC 9210) TaxID=578458 RepID=UPI00215E9A5D|nr:NAD(P)-binding protein [Schizophyllum commune H4-8]KAI5888316.1 NAD(P)-binding protein [Schizophyllum commune H4-8]